MNKIYTINKLHKPVSWSRISHIIMLSWYGNALHITGPLWLKITRRLVDSSPTGLVMHSFDFLLLSWISCWTTNNKLPMISDIKTLITVIAWLHTHSDYLWISVPSENLVTHNPFLMWETHIWKQINRLHWQITLQFSADKCRYDLNTQKCHEISQHFINHFEVLQTYMKYQ